MLYRLASLVVTYQAGRMASNRLVRGLKHSNKDKVNSMLVGQTNVSVYLKVRIVDMDNIAVS